MTGFGKAVLAGVAAMGLTGFAAAQAGHCNMAGMGGGGGSTADKQFLMDATEGNEAEIQASQLALKKAKDADVKAYAQKMIDDHMQLMSSMKPLNDQMGVKAPVKLKPEHQAEAARLKAMSGEKFDKEYVTAMVNDHHKTLGMMKNEQSTTSNQQIKDALQTAIPIVQTHTEMADSMAGKMNVPVPSTPAGQ